MLLAIAVVLFLLWGVGLVTSYTMGGLIHILLAVVVIVVLGTSFGDRERASDMT